MKVMRFGSKAHECGLWPKLAAALLQNITEMYDLLNVSFVPLWQLTLPIRDTCREVIITTAFGVIN